MAIAIDESKITYSGDGEANLQNFDVYTKTEINSAVQGTSSLYDETATYTLGSYCIYNNTLYRSTTAITTPEPFTSSHWESVSLSGLKEEVEETPSWGAFSIGVDQSGYGYKTGKIQTNLPKGLYLFLIFTNISIDSDIVISAGVIETSIVNGTLIRSCPLVTRGKQGGGAMTYCIVEFYNNTNSLSVYGYDYEGSAYTQRFKVFALKLGSQA